MNFKLLTLILLLFMSACVGTIKDKSKKTSTSVAAIAKVVFDGVVDGGAISHDKLWVRFKPATGGSGVFSYHAFLDGLTIPHIALNMSAAIYDDEGFIVMAIPELKKFTPYRINVRVYDTAYSLYDDNNSNIEVWTADDYLPVFDGVSKLENVNGIDAMTSLKVRWNTATIDPTAPFDASYSILGYSIYHSTDEGELWSILRESDPLSIDFSKYPNSHYKSVTDPSASDATITGLTPGANYFVAVRARDSYSTPRYERNFVIKSLDTYTHQPIEFAGLTSASVPVTQAGFSQVKLSWLSCTACGVYKVYAKPASIDNGSVHPGTDMAYLVGTVSNLALTATSMGGLLKNTSYKVYMLACHDMTCGWDGTSLDERDVKGRFSSQSITTTPPIAPYSTEPDTPTQPAGEVGLTSLDINFELDQTSGYFSKVRVYQVLDKNGDTTNYNGANFRLISRSVDANLPYIDPTVNTSPLNYATNPTSIRVANLAMGQEYCFQVLPFIEYPDLNTEGDEITLALAGRPPVVCGTPSYVAPDFGVTSFFPICSNVTANSVTIAWSHPPTPNVISTYEVYSKEGSGAFTFAGVDGAWNNHDAGDDYALEGMLLTSVHTMTISNLIPNTTYAFGVNTYYKQSATSEPIRMVPSDSAASVYCTTEMPDVVHGGWRDIFAVGPKIDGLRYNIKVDNGVDAATAREDSIVPEFILPDRKIPYEWSNRNSATEAGYSVGDDGGNVPESSTTGMVRLTWNDFTVYGSDYTISDYYTEGGTGLGYRVYRVALDDVPEPDRPGNDGDLDTRFSNDIRSDTNDNWSLGTPLRFVTHTYDVSASIWDTEPHKIAYSSSSINSDTDNGYIISAGNVRLKGADKIFEIIDYPPANGKTYFYKVVAVFAGVNADFAASQRINTVKVVVPPDNMALVHRWSANQEMCALINRGIGDNCKSPNKTDGTFDASLCSDPERNYRCVFDGMGSFEDDNDDGVPDPFETNPVTASANYNGGAFATRYYDAVRSFVIDRFEAGWNFTMKSGQCPNSGDANGYCWGRTSTINANDGEVGDRFVAFYNPYVKTGATTWTSVGSFSDIQYGLYGEGVVSNNAYLPPAIGINGILISGRTVVVDGEAKEKKALSRKEFMIASSWGQDTYGSNTQNRYISNLEGGGTLNGHQSCNAGSNAMQFNADTYGSSLDSNAYPYHNLARTGSNTTTIGNYSTAFCVSKYGAQDITGNLREFNRDQILCDGVADTLVGACSFRGDDSGYATSLTPIYEASLAEEETQFDWRTKDGYFLGETGGSTYVIYANKAFQYFYQNNGNFSLFQGMVFATSLNDDNLLLPITETTDFGYYLFNQSRQEITGTPKNRYIISSSSIIDYWKRINVDLKYNAAFWASTRFVVHLDVAE